MAPQDADINALCDARKTREIAQSFYTSASRVTAHGTGHELGQLSYKALPAICAFLASESVGKNEVSQEQARARACVDAATFAATLATVQRLIPDSSTSVDINRITCASLVRRHEVREDAHVAMMEVGAALHKSGALSRTLVNPESAVVQCTIFHWVCTNIFPDTPIPEFLEFADLYHLSPAKCTAVSKLLKKHCFHMVERLAKLARTAAAPRTTRSQTRRLDQKIGSGSSQNWLRPSADSSIPVTSQKLGALGAVKRKEPTDPRQKEPETPTKRRKGTELGFRVGQDVTTHTPKARRGIATALTVTPSVQEDEEEEVSNETIVVRRSTRTSRHLPNYSAWDAQHPITTASVDSKQSTPPSPTHQTPLNKIASMNSTPATSTGMSDVYPTSIPSRGRSSRPTARARFKSVSPVGSSSSFEEEMPRHRRRNLRAPFLDPCVYSWKPSGRTSQILDRARKWEELLIRKYGDPWDNL